MKMIRITIDQRPHHFQNKGDAIGAIEELFNQAEEREIGQFSFDLKIEKIDVPPTDGRLTNSN